MSISNANKITDIRAVRETSRGKKEKKTANYDCISDSRKVD